MSLYDDIAIVKIKRLILILFKCGNRIIDFFIPLTMYTIGNELSIQQWDKEQCGHGHK